MNKILLVSILLLSISCSKMKTDLNFYKCKWNDLYLGGAPKEIVLYRYNRDSKKLETGGTAYKEVIKFDSNGKCISHIFHYNHPPESSTEYHFSFSDSLLISEKQINSNANYVTEYFWLPSSKLDYSVQYKIDKNSKTFSEGVKFEYINFNDDYLVSKEIKIRDIKNDTLILGDTIIKEYDEFGRLSKEISPIHMRDSHWDYKPDSRQVKTYSYRESVVEITKSYTNSEDKETYFERRIGKLSLYASSYENAISMTFDQNKNLLQRGTDNFKYDFDKCGNWIFKYRSGNKYEEREIKYY